MTKSMSSFHQRAILTAILLGFISIEVHSEGKPPLVSNPACPDNGIPGYDPTVYENPTNGICIWKRPENVRFVSLQGCGGGGAGATWRELPPKNDLELPTKGVGFGGSAGDLRTLIVGPLSQSEYEIRVAGAALPDADGEVTAFVGQDVNIVFRGGKSGAGAGRPSPYAEGGAPRMSRHPASASLGGDAGMGPGGTSGTHLNGATVVRSQDGGRCAGGGGGIGGFRADYNVSPGKGGVGWLLIIPIIQYVPEEGPKVPEKQEKKL